MMTSKKSYIQPTSSIDVDDSLQNYFDLRTGHGREAADALIVLVKNAVRASSDMTWPAARALAFDLKRHGEIDIGHGLVAAPVEMDSKWNAAFRIGPMHVETGYFFNCAIRPEMTSSASAAAEVFFKRKQQSFALLKETLAPEDVGRAKYRHFFVDLDPEEEALKADPGSYLDPAECMKLQRFDCSAFGKVARPEGWDDGTPSPLEKVIRMPFGEWHSEGVFGFSYPWDFDSEDAPRMDTMDRYGDPNASLVALSMLGKAIDAAGLGDILAKRRDRFADIAYSQLELGGKYEQHDRLSRLVAEMAVGSVYEDGGCAAGRTQGLVSEFWQMSSAAEFDSSRADLEVMRSLLREHGHTHSENEMESGDMDDYAWLDEDAEGGYVLWLRSQHGQYRIECRGDEEHAAISIARTGRRAFDHSPRPILPGEPGFIISFATDPRSEKTEVVSAAQFTTRKMRDLANVLFSIRSVTCSLEMEYGRVDRGAPLARP